MIWPDSIPYGAINIQIRFVHPDELENCIGDYRIHRGHATCRTDETLQDGLRDSTVAHELVHAWIRLSGINLDPEVEETVGDAISQGVVQLLGALHQEPDGI